MRDTFSFNEQLIIRITACFTHSLISSVVVHLHFYLLCIAKLPRIVIVMHKDSISITQFPAAGDGLMLLIVVGCSSNQYQLSQYLPQKSLRK